MMTKINTQKNKNNVWQPKNKRKRNNTEVWLLCRLKLFYIPSGTWVNMYLIVVDVDLVGMDRESSKDGFW